MSLANAPTGGRPSVERPHGPIRGLYAITPDWVDSERLYAAVRAALSGGARALQYRHKGADARLRREQASRLQALCAEFGVPLIVNDDVELALETGAAGVHVGRDDADPATVRRAIGAARLLGVSCYDRFELAEEVAPVADYVAFGSVFASPTKPNAVRAPLALFGRARAAGLNTVAIGGIDATNAAQVIAAGADAIAVISDLFDAADVAARARALQSLFG